MSSVITHDASCRIGGYASERASTMTETVWRFVLRAGRGVRPCESIGIVVWYNEEVADASESF